MFVDNLIDRELIIDDTYSQMLHVEHGKEIEFVSMAKLYPLFHREEMDNLIHTTDEMVEQYFQANKETYKYPAKAKLSMIVIQGGENEESKKKAFEKAEKAYKELKPGLLSFKKAKDFTEIARKYSEDEETASNGGRLEVDVYECRNSIEYMLFHGFHKQIFDLKPGDISDIFEFENNYHIVQVREMDSRKQLTFEEVREKVKEDLYAGEHEKVMENWEDELLQTAGFKIYDRILEEMLAETKVSQKT
jgi:parvulin-like peptidyl-prolyl isomerase